MKTQSNESKPTHKLVNNKRKGKNKFKKVLRETQDFKSIFYYLVRINRKE